MGLPPKLSQRECMCSSYHLMQHWYDTLHVITGRFNAATGMNICEHTGRLYVRKLNLHSYVAVHKLYLSRKNIASLIQWALPHQDWTLTQRGRFMFIDKSSFTFRQIL